jgi:hypothetical protein
MAERPAACEAWREDLAAWAVAQISPAREAALDAHLATCATCRAEADALLAVAATALAVDADRLAPAPPGPAAAGEPAAADVGVEPPADLGERIAGRIARERRARLLRRAVVAAAGAAAAALVVVVSVVALAGDGGPTRIHGQEFAFTTAPPGATATAVVAEDAAGSVVQLAATGLDPDTTYALWLSHPQTHPERVPAGTFRPERDGTVDVVLHCSLPADEVGRVWATTDDGLALDTA